MLCQRVDLSLLFPSFASWLLLQLLHVPPLLSQTLKSILNRILHFSTSFSPLPFPFLTLFCGLSSLIYFPLLGSTPSRRCTSTNTSTSEWVEKKGWKQGRETICQRPKPRRRQNFFLSHFSLLAFLVHPYTRCCSSLLLSLSLSLSLIPCRHKSTQSITGLPLSQPVHLISNSVVVSAFYHNHSLTHSLTHPHILTLLLVGRLLPTNCS